MCGPAGSGKSTWAAKHFISTQIVSSDQCRALVCDDASNQAVSKHAFEVMHFIIEKRLALDRLTVVDATNLRREHRGELITIASRYSFNTAAIVFDVPAEVCLERNSGRDRKVPREALMSQHEMLKKALRTVDDEGFSYVYVLDQDTQASLSVSVGAFVSHQPLRQAPESESRA